MEVIGVALKLTMGMFVVTVLEGVIFSVEAV